MLYKGTPVPRSLHCLEGQGDLITRPIVGMAVVIVSLLGLVSILVKNGTDPPSSPPKAAL